MASSDNETLSADEATALTRANNDFALTLYKRLAEEKRNVFFSPISVSTALAMLLCGAGDETAQEMRRVLGYQHASVEDQSVVSWFRRALERVKENEDGNILTYANSLLSQKDFRLKDEYKSMIEDSFKALLLEVDFVNEPEEVANRINQWVREKTNDAIPRLLDSLDPATVLAIMSAVYFKGTWLYQFDEKATCSEFFVNQGDLENIGDVDMMHLRKRFPYVEMESFKALQLPYEGENMAMLVLLPNDELEELEGFLNPTFLRDLKLEMKETLVEVSFPKFRLEYSKSLKGVFQSLGMGEVFRRGADLGGMSDSTDLEVSEILHKAVLEVNEAGSETATVGGFTVTLLCRVRDPEFIVSHPFAFIIYDTRSDLIYFMGRVEEL